MGFFASGTGTKTVKDRPSDDLLHKLECKACPLNKIQGLITPKMQPTGKDKPLIYILGESPGRIEDEEGQQFVGPSGDLLRPLLPRSIRTKIRWNNTIRCRPPDNRNPDKIEIECCRPSIERDIEESKPVAILGFGAVALSWANKPSGIELWRGRRFPIQIGEHVCWYYAIHHPAFLLHTKQSWGKSDEETAFEMDVKKAVKEIEAGLPEPVIHSTKQARSRITCLTGSANDLNYLIEFLEYAGTQYAVGYDSETQNIRPYNANSLLLTKAVATQDETVAFPYEYPVIWGSSDLEKIRKHWIKFLKSPAKKAVHNLSFEMEWQIYEHGRSLARSVPWEDTLTQAFVLDERIGEHKPGALSLEFIGLQYFGIDIKNLTKGLNKEKMAKEPLHVLLPYNAIDAKYHLNCFLEQEARIEAENLVEVYKEKLRQVPTTVLTQIKGVPIDREENEKLDAEYEIKKKKAVERVQELPEAQQYKRLTGKKFNPGSPQDVQTLLKDILKTREGQEGNGWSTKESILSKIDQPITKAILNYRKVVKIKGTYVEPARYDSATIYPGNLLHQSLGTCFTETGRLQSEDPNMQNWPIRTVEGKKARRQVKKPVVASFDYGQIDARIIGCGSRDKNYCKALWENYDIHMEWALRLAKAFPWLADVKDEKAMKAFRSNVVKSNWVFALFYGASLNTTAGRFNIEQDKLRPFYEQFWKQFVDVKAWQEKLTAQFNEYGYVQLFDGLRRRAPLGHGQIINTPVQGATNRIVMHAMNRLSEYGDTLEKKADLYQANMQIHDDLTFLFDSENDFIDTAPRILDIMLDGREFDWFAVPLIVEVKSGPSWADMEEIGVYSSADRLGWPVRAKEFM